MIENETSAFPVSVSDTRISSDAQKLLFKRNRYYIQESVFYA